MLGFVSLMSLSFYINMSYISNQILMIHAGFCWLRWSWRQYNYSKKCI